MTPKVKQQIGQARTGITLTVPALAPSLNGSGGLMRMHWATYGKIRDGWTVQLRAARTGRGWPLQGPLSVVIVRHYSKRPLDLDGLYAACKVPLDALRHAGIIPDDNPDVVTGLTCRQVKVGTVKEERTEITLEPVSP